MKDESLSCIWFYFIFLNKEQYSIKIWHYESEDLNRIEVCANFVKDSF